MQLNLEPEVYHRFHKVKQLHKSFITDSEFLAVILNHIQKCGSGLDKYEL